MTWYHRVSESGDLEIWDHTQDPSADAPLVTRENDGSGHVLPDDVLDVMLTEAEAAFGSDQTRVIKILRDAAFEQIEDVNGGN